MARAVSEAVLAGRSAGGSGAGDSVATRERGHGARGDNRAALVLEPLAAETLVGAQTAVEVDIDDAGPMLFGDPDRWGLLERARGVHEDVDLAKRQHGCVAQW